MNSIPMVRVDPDKVMALMAERQLSQVRLAKIGHLAQPSLSKLLSKHHMSYTAQATIPTVERLATALNVPLEEILLPPGAPLPRPDYNPDGSINVKIMPYVHNGILHEGYTRVLRPGVHFNTKGKRAYKYKKPAAQAADRAVMLTRPQPKPIAPENGAAVTRYTGPARMVMIVNGGEPIVYDLTKGQVFFIR